MTSLYALVDKFKIKQSQTLTMDIKQVPMFDKFHVDFHPYIVDVIDEKI